MKTEMFSLFRDYEIKCKLFAPDDRRPDGILLGVHGFAGDKDSSMLKRLAGKAVSDGYALLCFDLPAHGESPVFEESLTVQNCCSDLSFVADYVRKNHPNAKKAIFATSFGAYLSILCAPALSDFSFILRAPAVSMPQILINTVLKTDRESFRAAGVIECGFERKLSLPYSFSEELDGQVPLSSLSFSQRALIIHGDCDDIVPLPHVLEFAKGRDNVKLCIMEGADHRFKSPGEIDTVIALTREFLGDK